MNFKLFDSNLNSKLTESAKRSERLRSHLNLHKSYDDSVQRIIISLVRGTYIPPHYHEQSHQWEFFKVISGDVSVLIFDSNGVVTHKIPLGQKTGVYGIELPPGTIHTLFCDCENSIIMELKEGPFNPSRSKVIMSWSPDENYQNYSREYIMDILENIAPGESFPAKLSRQGV